MDARIAMIAITTSNSIRVKAVLCSLDFVTVIAFDARRFDTNLAVTIRKLTLFHFFCNFVLEECALRLIRSGGRQDAAPRQSRTPAATYGFFGLTAINIIS